MTTERRQWPRQKLESPELLDMGAENGGLVVDVSERGLGFQLVSPIEKDRTVNFAFSLGSNQLNRAQARVVWVSDEGKMGGMVFTSLPEYTRKHLQRCLEGPEPSAQAAAQEEALPLRSPAYSSAVIPSGLGLSHLSAPAPMPPPIPATAPELPRRAEFPPRDVGNIFSRTPYLEEEAESGGHKKFAAFVLITLFLVAGFSAAELFPWVPGEILAKIRSTTANLLASAAPRKASPPPSGPQTPEAQPAPDVSASTSKHSATPADPFFVARAHPVKRSRASSALSRAFARGMPESPERKLATKAPSATTAPERRVKPQMAAIAPPLTLRATRSAEPTQRVNPFAKANELAVAKAPMPVTGSPAANAASSGATEYLRGENYLTGRGVPRDPAEAAHWLWISESDGYTPAAIALADLYLSGQGVSRSCLQARILLTTAARKNNKAAEQQLSELPENCD